MSTINQQSEQEYIVGIRAEDYSAWERRVPITPRDMKEIKVRYPNIKFIVQPSKKRIFQDHEFEQNGAIISDDLTQCQLILGVKRPKDQTMLLRNKTYLFFAHIVKAQSQNMPLLDELLRKNIRFIDYECMQDDRGKRILTFGKYGGIAGTIDFLAGLGQYILQKGYSTPILNIGYSYKYFNIADAFDHLQLVSKQIVTKQLPLDICPLIIGITGSGEVSQGTWQVLQNLPIKIITPDQMEGLVKDKNNPKHRETIYVTTIETKHMVQKIKKAKGPKDKNQKQINESVFNSEDYLVNPEKYSPIFHEKYLPYISVLMNNMYWDSRYPRLIEKSQIQALGQKNKLRLLGICDVSCDLNGSIEFLDNYTNPDSPFFGYNVLTGLRDNRIKYQDNSILYMAFDSLPCLLPRDASIHCSEILKTQIPIIMNSDKDAPFEKQELTQSLKNGLITLNGKLTGDYKFIEFLREKKEQLKQQQLARILYYLNLRISGDLFDTNGINEITDILQNLNIKYNFSDSKVGNSANEPSTIIIQMQTTDNAEILKTAKISIEKLCEKYKLTMEDLQTDREYTQGSMVMKL